MTQITDAAETMAEKTTTMTFRIEPSEKEEFEAFCKERDVPAALMARKALKLIMAKTKRDEERDAQEGLD